jgi:hypothetical protein
VEAALKVRELALSINPNDTGLGGEYALGRTEELNYAFDRCG